MSAYDDVIERLVAAAPELTDEQRWKLSVLMYPEGVHLRKPDFSKSVGGKFNMAPGGTAPVWINTTISAHGSGNGC